MVLVGPSGVFCCRIVSFHAVTKVAVNHVVIQYKAKIKISVQYACSSKREEPIVLVVLCTRGG